MQDALPPKLMAVVRTLTVEYRYETLTVMMLGLVALYVIKSRRQNWWNR